MPLETMVRPIDCSAAVAAVLVTVMAVGPLRAHAQEVTLPGAEPEARMPGAFPMAPERLRSLRAEYEVPAEGQVDDITGVRASSYETLYRFEPQGTGVFIAHLFDPETNTHFGARVAQGEEPRAFSARTGHPVFAIPALPHLTAAARMEPGDAYRLPFLRR